MNRPRRILTVCLGNICRSPLAAAVLAQRGGADVEVRSAGLRDKWAGGPAHPQMVAAAAVRGYDLAGHRAAQVTPESLIWADSVLAMDTSVLDALEELAPDEETRRKIRRYLADQDVPDPYSKGEEAFAEVVELVEHAATVHLPSS
ncbi:low molecular weight protein-tyrosine-phosphatase [Streptomyces goshikiensis]|uniref:low molecular weight protein-tyrosine-phosphatase n=1 Tax=Streptomyces goshikiensis TaxID=1942 RepID=UPI00371B8A48